ncbi:cytochrome P450 [Xenorhabdus griffiniae]|uniref:cytochrome P450 n=1 Tax=Xenorhabdus griffiniae TaxID=351672 RepID=UPI0030CA6F72
MQDSLFLKYKFLYYFLSKKLYYFFKCQSKKHVQQQKIRFGKTKIYFAHNPEIIRSVFKYGKRLHREPLQKIIGKGLFSEETSPKSRERRKKIQNTINRDVINYIDLCIHHNFKTFKFNRLKDHEIMCHFRRLSIETNVDIILSPENNNDKKKLSDAVGIILDYIEYDLFTSVKILKSKKKQFFLAKKQIFNYVSDNLNKSHLKSDNSFLGCLTLLYNQGELTEEQINDEILSFLGSGVETTGTMLFWVMKCFMDYSAEAEKIKKEITQENVNHKSVLKNRYFNDFVLETLRYYPAAWAMIRYIDNDCIPSIEPESFVWVSPCMTHFDERYWEKSELFYPERFNHPYDKNTYFPFAQGTHKCFGEYLAMSQMKAFLYLCATRLDTKRCKIKIGKLSSKLALAPKKIRGELIEYP